MLDNGDGGRVAMEVGIGVLEVCWCDFIAFGDGSSWGVEMMGEEPFVGHGDVEGFRQSAVGDTWKFGK